MKAGGGCAQKKLLFKVNREIVSLKVKFMNWKIKGLCEFPNLLFGDWQASLANEECRNSLLALDADTWGRAHKVCTQPEKKGQRVVGMWCEMWGREKVKVLSGFPVSDNLAPQRVETSPTEAQSAWRENLRTSGQCQASGTWPWFQQWGHPHRQAQTSTDCPHGPHGRGTQMLLSMAERAWC